VLLEGDIQTLSTQNLIFLEADQGPGAFPPGASIERDVTGNIQLITAPSANIAEREINGVDVRVGYDLETAGFGNFDLELLWSRILSYDFQGSPTSNKTDIIGNEDTPEDRGQFRASWALADHTVAFITDYIGGHGDANSSAQNEVGSHTQYHIQYQWATPWDGDVVLGVRNITDEDPELSPTSATTRPYNIDLYNPDGRVPYITYRQRF
jgi:iron complex outermembrane receptor protein